MTPKQAIETLNQQIQKLSREDIHTDVWISATRGLVNDYFGPDSAEMDFIKHFRFDATFSWSASEQERTRSKTKAKQFLKDCISTIERKGLYKESKTNFLTYLHNGWAFSVVMALLSAWTVVCVKYGENSTGLKNIELRQQIKVQQATIENLKHNLETKKK